MAARCCRLLRAGTGGSELMAACDELLQATQVHFSHEETLMASCGFPALEAHSAEHREGLAYFRDLSRRLSLSDSAEDARYAADFIEAWFELHLSHRDRELVDHLR